jgi:hypothetical protein
MLANMIVALTEREERSRRGVPKEGRKRCPGKEEGKRTGRRKEEGIQTGRGTPEWECQWAPGWK